jgi:hypothetical protein
MTYFLWRFKTRMIAHKKCRAVETMSNGNRASVCLLFSNVVVSKVLVSDQNIFVGESVIVYWRK